MADYITQGNKTVYCEHGHANIIPFLQTSVKCSTCHCKFFVKFFGVVKDKNDSYIF